MPIQGLLYAALAVFLAGNLIRIVRIATMPLHVRWELYPIPHGVIGQSKTMLSEILLLRGVWENNRVIWPWSWLMHLGLYLLVGAAGLALVGALGFSAAGASGVVLWLAFSCGFAGTLGMIATRLGTRKLCSFTSVGTLFNLFLLLALFSSGLLKMASPRMEGVAAAHLGIVAFFLAYFPFTHMTHMYLKYFTYHSVRWDDAPAPTEKVIRNLGYPVSWSAPHIQGDGIQTWADVAKKH